MLAEKMINNRKLIESLMIFPNKDCFYFVQILQRKKDHAGVRLGGSNNNSRLIKAYYITSLEKLDLQWEEMTKLAELFDARVQINLNPRNFRKAGFQVLQKIANQMSNDDFGSIYKAYNTVCGEYHSEIDKRWIVDIDDTGNKTNTTTKAELVVRDIERLHGKINNKDYSILSLVPSKTGYHLITNPFNLAEFELMHPDCEVHKNNPTNLYIP